VLAVHAAALAWIFGGLVTGRVLYFRDLSTHYAPDFAVAAAALRAGFWPAWNPAANAGEPFILAYPVDAALLLIGGPRAPLGVGAALHLALALLGALLLARRLGLGPWGALVTSASYGLGGFVLSTVNLVQLFEAAAWAPLVVLSFLDVCARPGGRRLAAFATLLGLQVTTIGLEIVAQTLLVGLLLAGRHALGRHAVLRVAGGLVVAGLLAAPGIFGVASLLHGTARGEGFRPAEALAYSVHPVVLLEALLPRFLGDPHAFSDRDLWGRAHFPEGYPYLLSTYGGPIVLLLALQARGRAALKVAAGVATVLALGAFGPLAGLLAHVALPFRGPQKLLFLLFSATAVLAGLGLERRISEPAGPSSRRLLLVPGLAMLALLAALHFRPDEWLAAGSVLVPPLADPRARVAATQLWPTAWGPTAALTLLSGLLLGRGGRWAGLAAPLVALDLVLVNGSLNPLADRVFYDLRPDVHGLVAKAGIDDGLAGARWFSYGVANTPGLAFEPTMQRAGSDVWLYYLDRQSLLPRTPALDGLPGAFDVDRTGWAPRGATLAVPETVPERFSEVYPRFRLAGVRWILSFRPLPPSLVRAHASVKLPEVTEPLGLFELRGALPRAYFAASLDAAESMPLVGPDVRYEYVDAHTVRIHARTPPGFVIVLDGYHPDWTAQDESRSPVPVLRANGRYRAIPTDGGVHVFTLRYRPRWRGPALAALAAGLVAAVALALAGSVSEFTARRGTRRANLRAGTRM
jgi:hypothetical protein